MNRHNLAALAIVAATTGCGHSQPHSTARPQAPSDEIPASVSVAAAAYTFGFALSVPRIQVSVDAFNIAKRPITVGQYAECVAAGACSVPSSSAPPCAQPSGAEGATYSQDPAAADLVATCATPAQINDYCGWVGGRPATAAEWVLAARGPKVHRYAWGDGPPTCNARARVSFFADYPDPCCGKDCTAPDIGHVGQHDSAYSSSGLADVLVTRGEYLGPDLSPGGPGCLPSSNGCLVVSIGAGGIDGLTPLPAAASDGGPVQNATGVPVFSFRCVWPGGSR